MIERLSNARIHIIDSGKPGAHVLVSAGVHGDEFEPILAAHALVNDLEPLVTAGKVTIIPVVNTTAFAAGTRCGEDGLDLARVCPGNPQGTATLQDAAFISSLIEVADYYIDMHTGGALFNIYPLAGYMLHPDQAILDKQRSMAEAFGLPILWGTESTPEGRTISVARDAGVPAIYVEYAGGGVLNSKVISSYRKGVMQVLAHLDVISPLPSGNIPKPVYMVEDGTANSGYLQGKLPAPGAGIFASERSPGDMLHVGEKIGTIVDPVLGKELVVTADINGLLLFIRTASLVKEGDALGGILPITEPGKVTVNG